MVAHQFSALSALALMTSVPIGAPMEPHTPYRQRKADLKKHQAIVRRDRRKRAFKRNIGNQFALGSF